MKKAIYVFSILLVALSIGANYTKGQVSFNFDKINSDSHVSGVADIWYYNKATQKCVKGSTVTVDTTTYITEQKCKDANNLNAPQISNQGGVAKISWSPVFQTLPAKPEPKVITSKPFPTPQWSQPQTQPFSLQGLSFFPTATTIGKKPGFDISFNNNTAKIFGVTPKENNDSELKGPTKPGIFSFLIESLGFNKGVNLQYQSKTETLPENQPVSRYQFATTTSIFGDDVVSYQEPEARPSSTEEPGRGERPGLLDKLSGKNDANPLVVDEVNSIPIPTLPPGEGGTAEKRWTYDGNDFKFKIKFLGNESANYKKGESIRFYADIATWQKSAEWRYLEINFLFSYIAKDGSKKFASSSKTVKVPPGSNPPTNETEWYETTSGTDFIIPHDIKIEGQNSPQGEGFRLDAVVTLDVAEAKKQNNWDKLNKDSFFIKIREEDFLKNYNCRIELVSPKSKSNFFPGKDPYFASFNLDFDLICDSDILKGGLPEIEVFYLVKCPVKEQANNKGSAQVIFSGNRKIKTSFTEHPDGSFRGTASLLKNTTIYEENMRRAFEEGGKFSFDYFGLNERCDVNASLSIDNTLVYESKDYFYLNQCEIAVENEHPEWTYCTEDKNGRSAPITLKMTYSNCAVDNYFMKDVVGIILKPRYNSDFNAMGYKVIRETKNGQIFWVDVSDKSLYWHYFVQSRDENNQVHKNMANNPSNITFFLEVVRYLDNKWTPFVINEQRNKENVAFKIFHGSGNDNVKCDNIGKKGGMPAINIISNVFQSIGSFFKGIFIR